MVKGARVYPRHVQFLSSSSGKNALRNNANPPRLTQTHLPSLKKIWGGGGDEAATLTATACAAVQFLEYAHLYHVTCEFYNRCEKVTSKYVTLANVQFYLATNSRMHAAFVQTIPSFTTLCTNTSRAAFEEISVNVAPDIYSSANVTPYKSRSTA